MTDDQEPDYIRAHRHCTRNRAEIERSELCGCFYCLHIFSPSEIFFYSREPEQDEDQEGVTAWCPKCPVDSVIGSASGFPITKEFLQQMKNHWFAPIGRPLREERAI